jgi:hypothetical protein
MEMTVKYLQLQTFLWLKVEVAEARTNQHVEILEMVCQVDLVEEGGHVAHQARKLVGVLHL